MSQSTKILLIARSTENVQPLDLVVKFSVITDFGDHYKNMILLYI